MNHKVILLVDDNPDDVDLTLRAFKKSNSYIRKPVDFVQFVDAVKKLGIYWLLINEPPITRGI